MFTVLLVHCDRPSADTLLHFFAEKLFSLMKTSDIFVKNLVNKKLLLAAFYHLTYQHDSKDFNIRNYKLLTVLRLFFKQRVFGAILPVLVEKLQSSAGPFRHCHLIAIAGLLQTVGSLHLQPFMKEVRRWLVSPLLRPI